MSRWTGVAAAVLLTACNPAGEAEQAAPNAAAPEAEAAPVGSEPAAGSEARPEARGEAPAEPPGDYPGVAEMSAWQRRAFDAGYRDCRAGRYAPDAWPEAYRIGCGVAQERMAGGR